MAGIQLSGLVSGLDTQSIIGQLMAVERQPRQRITMQQAVLNKRQSLLQDLSSKLDMLKMANDDLKSVSTWLDTQSVSSSDTTKVDVTRTGGAAPGGYDVNVTQLAAAERRTYDYQPPASATSLDIFNPDGTTRSSVPLAAGATVDDAVSAINSDSKAGVFAVNVNGDLVMASKTTGAANGFTAGPAAGAQLDAVAGLDAQFTIGSTSYTRASNVVSDALPGLQLTLKGKTPAGPVSVNVGNPGPDSDLIVGKVKAFVDAYNAVVSTARLDLADKKDPKAATLTDAQRGTLFGDSGVNTMLASLRSAVGSPVAGLSGLTSLADIGVTTGAASAGGVNHDAVDGKLTVDTAKLTAAITNNPNGVKQLLGATANVSGFGQAFGTTLSSFQGPTGLFQTRLDSVAQQLTDVADRLTAFDDRIDAKQAYYQKQFTALETALSNSQAQGSRLAGFGNSG